MKFVTFTQGASTRIGLVHGDEVVDLSASGLPGDMTAFLAGGADAMGAARKAATGRTARVALGDVRLAAPVPRPPKFLAIGLNYADHVKESGMTPPPVPVFFNKQSTCVTGPYDPIHLPSVSPLLDY